MTFSDGRSFNNNNNNTFDGLTGVVSKKNKTLLRIAPPMKQVKLFLNNLPTNYIKKCRWLHFIQLYPNHNFSLYNLK